METNLVKKIEMNERMRKNASVDLAIVELHFSGNHWLREGRCSKQDMFTWAVWEGTVSKTNGVKQSEKRKSVSVVFHNQSKASELKLFERSIKKINN